ncbi:cytochrome P450 [Streptomyces mashuensis]|uniref:Cytochrome P450 n=1 Tax=Streptomyces mashuensis TaxID=33904 RepID=A0A919EF60_9ACTN|nr:cytochrome P450 [Streptomyces mashuensis]GHF60027.1 cytochrome P450 [Streptomyces mashuensis]
MSEATPLPGAVPPAPGAIPLLGHVHLLLRDPLRFLRSLPGGGLVRVRTGPWEAVVVCDPGLTRQVLLDDRTFDKGGAMYDRGREVFGNGLGTCPHAAHRRQRRLVQPAFHAARLPGYGHVMADQIDAVTGRWRNGAIIDVLAETQKLSARVVVATLFGAALTADEQVTAVLEDFEVIQRGIARRMLLPPGARRLPTPGNRRHDRARTRLRRTVGRLVADRRADGTDHGDLLSLLLTTDDGPDGPRLTDEEITDQVMTFYFGGMESTAATLAWALHLLTRHPAASARLAAEAGQVLPGGTVARPEDLPALRYTSRVVAETLRLYPPVWVLTRTVTTDTLLGGHLLPAGTTVVYSPYLLHHRADTFPAPERFDPGRWDAEPGHAPAHAGLVPFGGGARLCVGTAFALLEVTLALATLAARWHFEPLPGLRPARPALVLAPQGLRLRVTARTA